MKRYDGNCKMCGKAFTGNQPHKKFCSVTCTSKYHTKHKGIPLGTNNCKMCGKVFTLVGPNQKFCCEKCSRRYHEGGIQRPYVDGISTGTVGSIAELMVASELLGQGYEVFRTLSPHSFCDLIAFKDGKCRYIEVRTGHRNANGNLTYSKELARPGATEYAVYLHGDKNVTYIPVPLDGVKYRCP